jgi:hypothetical protein
LTLLSTKARCFLSFGIYKGNYLLTANRSPHPNAAKPLIRYMLGDASGSKGAEKK